MHNRGEPVKIPSRARTKPTSIRLSVAERRLIEAAAAQRQEYMAEYIRSRVMEAVRRDLVELEPSGG